jgi:hypothetical protein
MATARDLEIELQLSQDLARSSNLQKLRDEILTERQKVDVSGYWRGYNDKGQGIVEYRGKKYICTVLARKVKQYGAKVNLRRTPTGYFVNWS